MKLIHITSAIRYAWRRRITERLRRLELKKKGTDSFQHTTPMGHKFYLYPDQLIDRHIFIFGAYELRFLCMIERFFRDRQDVVMLDVGTNIGNHAVYLARTFKRIICFEPSPQIADRLKRNIGTNGLSNIEVHVVGLSNRTAVLPFRLNRTGNLGGSRFVGLADDTTVELQVVRGDEYCSKLGIESIDFIKIDVEYHELAVLEGLQATIQRFRPIIAFEFHGTTQTANEFAEISKILTGYSFFEATFAPASSSSTSKFLWQVRHRGFPVWARVAVPEARTYENIIAFPDEEVSRDFRAANVSGD